MRFHAKLALWLLLFCLAGAPAGLAQQRQGPNGAYRATREDPGSQPTTTSSRPLTSDEGLAILGAALDSRHHPVSTADCSHLVHALYERAGFHYAYAPSWDLYLGIDEFQRVTNPQPGDLAVWRGHAGIVVSSRSAFVFQPAELGPRSRFLRCAILEAKRPTAFLSLCQSGSKCRALRFAPDCKLESHHFA